MKEQIVAILGVAGDTADSVVLDSVRALKNRGVIVIDLGKELGLTDETQILNRVKGILADHKTLLEAQVETDLDQFKDIIVNRDAMKVQLLANRKDTLAFLANVKKPATPALHNRRNGKTPQTDTTNNEQDAEQKQANAIRNRATEIRRGTPTLTFDQAWEQAKTELAAKTA